MSNHHTLLNASYVLILITSGKLYKKIQNVRISSAKGSSLEFLQLALQSDLEENLSKGEVGQFKQL